MGLPRFIHVQEHKKFNFTPRYYDEDKEEREARYDQIRRENGIETDKPYVPHIKGRMRTYYKRESIKKGRESNIRLLIIIGILSVFAYYLLYY